MQLTYAFVYYFLLTFIALNFSLLIFVFRPFRKLLQKIQTKFKDFLNHNFFKYIIYFSFAIIFLILVDSVRAFYMMNHHFQQRTL